MSSSLIDFLCVKIVLVKNQVWQYASDFSGVFVKSFSTGCYIAIRLYETIFTYFSLLLRSWSCIYDKVLNDLHFFAKVCWLLSLNSSHISSQLFHALQTFADQTLVLKLKSSIAKSTSEVRHKSHQFCTTYILYNNLPGVPGVPVYKVFGGFKKTC